MGYTILLEIDVSRRRPVFVNLDAANHLHKAGGNIESAVSNVTMGLGTSSASDSPESSLALSSKRAVSFEHFQLHLASRAMTSVSAFV